MSNFPAYITKTFSPTQKFFVLDPNTGSPAFVQGSDLVAQLTPNSSYVFAESTRTTAQATDYELGAVIQTGGATAVGDNQAGVYLVVPAGDGDFPMDNGLELLTLAGDDTLLERLALNTVGEGSDLVAHTGTDDTVTEALNKRTIYVGSVAESFSGRSGADGELLRAIAFYNGGAVLVDPVGGGEYVFVASRAKSDHDGSKVVSPTVPALSAQASLGNFLDGSGETDPSGTGCYVKISTTFEVDGYGAIKNDTSAGSANNAAFKRAASSAIDSRYIDNRDLSESLADLRGNAVIDMGRGYYYFSESNPLRPQLGTDVETTNTKRRGLTFRGAGSNQTVLAFEGSPSFDFYYWSNYDDTETDGGGNRLYGYDNVRFEGISFTGPSPDASARTQAATNKRATGTQVNGFGIISTGWDKEFYFDYCSFEGIDTVLDIGGTSNGDKFTFNRCRLAPIRDAVFKCSNDQSVANSFIECNFFLYGDFFKITNKGGGGSNVFGGSLIMQPRYGDDGLPLASQDERAIVNGNFTESPSNRGSYYSLEGVTLELYNNSIKDVNVTRQSGEVGGGMLATFINTHWTTVNNKTNSDPGGNVDQDTYPGVVINGRFVAEVNYTNCLHDRRRSFEIVNDATVSEFSTIPVVRINDSKCLWDLSDALTDNNYDCITSKIGVTGAASVQVDNITYQLTRTLRDLRISSQSSICSVFGAQEVASENRVYTAMVKPIDRAWGAGASANKLVLPKSARVIGVEFYRKATSSPDSYTVTLTNNDGTTYGSWSSPENADKYVSEPITGVNHSGVLAVENTAGNLSGTDGYFLVRYI